MWQYNLPVFSEGFVGWCVGHRLTSVIFVNEDEKIGKNEK